MNGKSWYAIIRRGQSWYVSTATNLRGLGRMMILQIENLLYRFLTSLFTLPPVFLADWCRFGVADVTKSNFPSFPKILLHMRGFSALAHD